MNMPNEPSPDDQLKSEKEKEAAQFIIQFFEEFRKANEELKNALDILAPFDGKAFPLQFEVRDAAYASFMPAYHELNKHIRENKSFKQNGEFGILERSTSRRNNHKVIFTVDLKWVTELPPFSF